MRLYWRRDCPWIWGVKRPSGAVGRRPSARLNRNALKVWEPPLWTVLTVMGERDGEGAERCPPVALWHPGELCAPYPLRLREGEQRGVQPVAGARHQGEGDAARGEASAASGDRCCEGGIHGRPF